MTDLSVAASQRPAAVVTQERPPLDRSAWFRKAKERGETVTESWDECGYPHLVIGNPQTNEYVQIEKEAIMVFFKKGSKGPLFAVPTLGGEFVVSDR